MKLTYWHNPRCTKSRQGLELLGEKGIAPEVRLYLKDPASADELKSIATKLGVSSVRDMMRTKEAAYKDRGLADVSDEDALIAAMMDEPKLIERPILVSDTKAVIGRPTEALLKLVG